MEEKQGKVISGLYLQGVALHNPALNLPDAALFSLIFILAQGKKKCIASNAYLAFSLSVTERTVSRSIKKLKDEGYIVESQFNGRIRRLELADGWLKHSHFVADFNERLDNHTYTWDDPDPDSGKPCLDKLSRQPRQIGDSIDSIGDGNSTTLTYSSTKNKINSCTGHLAVTQPANTKGLVFKKKGLAVKTRSTPLGQRKESLGDSKGSNTGSSKVIPLETQRQRLQKAKEEKAREDVANGKSLLNGGPSTLDASTISQTVPAKYKPQHVPKTVRKLIDFWNACEGTPTHKEFNKDGTTQTATFVRAVKLLKQAIRGQLSLSVPGIENTPHDRQYIHAEIEYAIQNLNTAITDPDSEPKGVVKAAMKKWSLANFIYNSNRTAKKGKPRDAILFHSPFFEYVQGPPKKLERVVLVEDEYPRLTKLLKKYWEQEMHGGRSQKYDTADENKLRRGAQRLQKTIEWFYERDCIIYQYTEQEWCLHTVQGLVKRFPGQEFYLTHFDSQFTYSDVLFDYLLDRGGLREAHDRSVQHDFPASHEHSSWAPL